MDGPVRSFFVSTPVQAARRRGKVLDVSASTLPQPPPGPRLTPPPHPLLLNAEAIQSKSPSQSLSENLWLRKPASGFFKVSYRVDGRWRTALMNLDGDEKGSIEDFVEFQTTSSRGLMATDGSLTETSCGPTIYQHDRATRGVQISKLATAHGQGWRWLIKGWKILENETINKTPALCRFDRHGIYSSLPLAERSTLKRDEKVAFQRYFMGFSDLVVFVADIVTKLEYWIWKEIVLCWTIDLRKERGHALKCSHYIPLQLLDNSPLPCVIYCHGNRRAFSGALWNIYWHHQDPPTLSVIRVQRSIAQAGITEWNQPK
ncbi:alpha/beta-Hydrolases superfamily protein, partial [Striga asiatica]